MAKGKGYEPETTRECGVCGGDVEPTRTAWGLHTCGECADEIEKLLERSADERHSRKGAYQRA